MTSLPIANPFPGALSLLVPETLSTQDEARLLARRGFPEGSVLAAEHQSAGRGRGERRRWESEAGANLLFTLRLDGERAREPALPLRVGAALCRAAAALAAEMGRGFGAARDTGAAGPDGPRLKWPNDLLLGGRKAAGILCEAGAEGLFVGVGVNCNQRSFPACLAGRATSLALCLGGDINRWRLLELFLGELRLELGSEDWKSGVERLLWRRGELVRFVPGGPDSGPAMEGRLEGLDPGGALIIRPEGGPPAAFAAGELLLDGASAGPGRR